MSLKDMDRAARMGQWLRRFPEAWQTYQDWLGDLITSEEGLRSHHPAWQASLIFRWRLLYFGLYVGSRIAAQRLRKVLGKAPRLFAERDPLEAERYFWVLRRVATLLAVAELTLCGIAAFTGVMLAFYYQPTAVGAHASLLAIATQVSHGSLFLSLHNIAGNGLIVLALFQIVVLFLGRQFVPSWLMAWISGVLLTLSAIGLSWTAIVLNWDQIGFWRFKIELSIVETLPLVGPSLRNILAGGNGISTVTLQHMYTLHSYVLAIAALLLSTVHLMTLIFHKSAAEQTPLSALEHPPHEASDGDAYCS